MMQEVLLTTYRIGVSIGKTYHRENKERLGVKESRDSRTH